jgi:hypothetical protein
MPRLQPPEGYTTAADAASRLGVSDSLLSRYVQKGRLHRYGPVERQHKFYKLSEIDALLAAERVFPEQPKQYARGAWRDNPTPTFRLATTEDMPAIVEISRRIFGDPVPSVDARLAWLSKNAETFHVLCNEQATIVGYSSLLPLKKGVINRFIRDEIDAEQITGDEVEPYEPGRPLHLYVMSIGIDTCYRASEKHEYGAALVRGLFAFFYNLASRGIEIETITARSHKPDGLRLLRKMSIPQLRSPVAGKSLFVLKVAESGFDPFVRYCEHLAEWKRNHIIPSQKSVVRSPQPLFIDWIMPADIPAALKMLQQVYNEEVDLAEAAIYQSWRKHNNKLSMGAFSQDRQECYGSIQVVPLDERVILDILSGKRKESSIQPDEVRSYSEPGPYTSLATNAAVLPGMPRLLYQVLFRYMQFWIDQFPDRYITRVYAQAVSGTGDQMISHFFMSSRYDLAPDAYMLDLARPGASKVIRWFQAEIAKKGPLPDELRQPYAPLQNL